MKSSSTKGLPSERYRTLIDEYSRLIRDPGKKLKFIRNAVQAFQHIPRRYTFYSPFGEILLRKKLLDEAESVLPGSRKEAFSLMRKGEISSPPRKVWRAYRLRHLILLGGLLGLLFLFRTAMASWHHMAGTHVDKPVVAMLPDEQKTSKQNNYSPKRADLKKLIEKEWIFPDYFTEPIWLVEETDEVETYSNRLQIITRYAVDNRPRKYMAFPKESVPLSDNEVSTEVRGILYHASESDMLPFLPEKNRSLIKFSDSLRQYICRKKLYHYFIDRFGRVYRVVREEDAAFHAGNSVWADDSFLYLNLNHAFIGICFEGKGFKETGFKQEEMPKIIASDTFLINEAQIKSGKELTDFLRCKYKIHVANCIPHGLASVSPRDRLIGYHLDLSHGFPFYRFGLRNQYMALLPSMIEFGFVYDSYFCEVLGSKVWPGVVRSEDQFNKQASLARMSREDYRKMLQMSFDLMQKREKDFQAAEKERISNRVSRGDVHRVKDTRTPNS